MRGLLLDVYNDHVSEVEANSLESYYHLLGCRSITYMELEIEGKWYDVVCDDEALFVESPKISAVNALGETMLVGNLIILGLAGKGFSNHSTDLTDEDILRIQSSIRRIPTKLHPEGYQMLCNVRC